MKEGLSLLLLACKVKIAEYYSYKTTYFVAHKILCKAGSTGGVSKSLVNVSHLRVWRPQLEAQTNREHEPNEGIILSA